MTRLSANVIFWGRFLHLGNVSPYDDVMDDVAEPITERLSAPRGEGFSAAQLTVLRDGEPVARLALGHPARYAGPGAAELAPEQLEPLAPTTRFDIASLTKLLTASVVLETLAAHGVGLDEQVTRHLPAFTHAGVTIRHLLTHTSGLPAVWGGWRERPAPDAALASVLREPLEAPPGTRHLYSCLGYIAAGALVERVAGAPLDELLATLVTTPLGMTRTGYRPASPADTVATELQELPTRGVVRGRVHDETAAVLGGVAGNAGVFSTADDLALFGEELRTGSAGVLGARTRELMTTPQTPDGVPTPSGQAVGPRLGDPAFMGELAPGGIGHTGFTGTMLLVHPERRLTLALLTNRVHPSRDNDPNPFRRAIAAAIADA